MQKPINADADKLWVRMALLAIGTFVLLKCGAWAMASFEPVLTGQVKGAATIEHAWWPNLLPVLLPAAALWALSGRLLFTLWSGYWILWLLFYANEIKLHWLSRSLVPSDFALIPDVISDHKLFLPYANFSALGIAALLGVLGVAVLLAWLEPRTLRVGALPRLALTLIPGIAFASLLAGHHRWREPLEEFYQQHFHVWSPERSTRRVGLLAALTRLAWESRLTVEAPDRRALNQLIKENNDQIQARAQRPEPRELPDIVVVQSEALFDPATLRGMNEGPELKNFRRLAALGLSGGLSVPTYGGGTIRTEFEMLTGYPLDAFPAVEYPYFRLALRTPTSLARTLAAQGYRNAALHPYRAAFWNRDAALRQLGFQELQFEDNFTTSPRRGFYVRDEALYEQAMTTLPNDGPPYFLLLITMENHGPWNVPRGLTDEERSGLAVPPDLSEEAELEMLNYKAHLRSGDRALGAFADRLMARQRPTLLLVYSDHLPALDAVFAERGFDNDLEAWEQAVPYLLLSNRGLTRGRMDTESEHLASLLLDAAALPMNGYFALNAVVRDIRAFRPLDENDRHWLGQTLLDAARADYLDAGVEAN